MTDLLAPVLMTLNNDAEAFFCFTHLVERSPVFKHSGKKITLHRQVVRILHSLIHHCSYLFYPLIFNSKLSIHFLETINSSYLFIDSLVLYLP